MIEYSKVTGEILEPLPDLRDLTFDQLQAERFKWVAVEAVAKEAYEAARKVSMQALTPIIAELQARDQVQIDAACEAERVRQNSSPKV